MVLRSRKDSPSPASGGSPAAVTPAPPAARGPPPAPEVAPPRPVPERLRVLSSEVEALRRSSRFDEAAARTGDLIRELEAEWGTESRDLAPYHYDLAVSWRLAGDTGRAAEAAGKALEIWPDSLHLRVVHAVSRAEIATLRSTYDPKADAALASLLSPETARLLPSLRVRPGEIAARRADMLLRAGRPGEAIAAARAGLALAPGDRKLRELEAKVHLALHRPAEALEILDSLLREKPSDELSVFAGAAHLDAGDAGAAWKRFEEVLARKPAGLEPRPERDAPGTLLRVRAARALNALGRPREAASLLLEVLVLEPESPEALHQLAAASRALGATRGAEALSRRAAALAPHERARDSETAARRAGETASALYHRARALASIDRYGDALRILGEAAAIGPRIPDIPIEIARLREVLGRPDLAAHALIEARERAASPRMAAELARLFAVNGERAGAARLIEEVRAAGDGSPALAAAVARALLEVGDLQGAEAALRGAGDSPGARLARAEEALRTGDPAAARAETGEGPGDLPGGASWAGALLLLAGLAGEGPRSPAETARSADPSDLLDHARLLAAEVAEAARIRDPEALAWLEGARALARRRTAVLHEIRGRADQDARSTWLEAAVLLAEGRAGRKAREAAHLAVGLGPRDVEAHRALVRALAADEEVAARLAAAVRGLEVAPGDAEFDRARREALDLLGLGPPR